MHEEVRLDRSSTDDTPDRGDRGLVQPTGPPTDTYRGPYGEPIVIAVTDDPGDPNEPGGDAITDLPDRDLHRHSGNDDTNRHRPFDPYAYRWHDTVTDFIARLDRDSGDRQPDHRRRETTGQQ